MYFILEFSAPYGILFSVVNMADNTDYQVTGDELKQTLAAWDRLLPGRGTVHLIACGGTALSLLGYKETTKDVDFMVPVEKEYQRLVKFLIRAGYARQTGTGWKRPQENLVYDLFLGNLVYTTELLTSPLEGNGHRKVWEGKKIYLGILNSMDLIITKLFRGSTVDYEDCLTLVAHEDVDLRKLEQRFKETAGYDVSEQKLKGNFEHFLTRARRSNAGGDSK